MVTSLNLGENGRLGNQLFQYAALKGLATKNGYKLKIPNPSSKSWHGQTCMLDKFNIDCEFINSEDLKNLKYHYNEPDWKSIDYNFFNIPEFTNINGFFQSIFYFNHIEEEIKKELTPKKELLNKHVEFINNLKKIHECEIVSVHVRRGDNMTNNQELLIDAFKKGGKYEIYFNKAKSVFKKHKVKFLIFTGGQRWDENNNQDMDWCKDFFKGDEYIFSENQNQIDDFCRIMSCDHNILSHASSFGWWAAYVNKNPNKVVVAPEWYHPDEPNLKRNKFYPNNYILK
jgi:hypothetical protein